MTYAAQSLAISAAVLLLVSGLAKIRAPEPIVRLLAVLAVPPRLRGRAIVRAFAVGEAAVGAAYVIDGSRWVATALAVEYLIFTGFAATAIARGALVPCGCFGRTDAVLGRAHLIVTGLCAAVAAVAAINPDRPAWHGISGAVLLAQSVVLAWLAYLVLTLLPELAAARRLAEGDR